MGRNDSTAGEVPLHDRCKALRPEVVPTPYPFSCVKPTGHDGPHGYAGVFWPATPDAGDSSMCPSEPLSEDVEALAKVLAEGEPSQTPDFTAYYRAFAEAILASDWLAAREAKARAEAGEQIAQAMENAVVVESYGTHAERNVMHHAARIAREVTR